MSIERMAFENLQDVQTALTAPFEAGEIKKRSGWEFVPVEKIRERMLKVLGVDGFDVEFSEVAHHNEDWITCNCTITVDFTRWGGRIKKVTQADGIQLKRHTKGDNQGLIVDIGNDYKSVMSGSFSKAAQDLGIGLYIQLKKSGGNNGGNNYPNNNYQNNGSSNNNHQNNNGGNYEQLKKTIYACEQKIGITAKIKEKLFLSLFPGTNVQQVMQNPDEQQLETYKKIIQPVSFIILNADKANVPHPVVLQQLSQIFNRPVSNFTNVLTLATMQTVNDLKGRLQNIS